MDRHNFLFLVHLSKPIPVAKLVTEIINSHAVVVFINYIEAKKLEVGHLVINIVPNSPCISLPLYFLTRYGQEVNWICVIDTWRVITHSLLPQSYGKVY